MAILAYSWASQTGFFTSWKRERLYAEQVGGLPYDVLGHRLVRELKIKLMYSDELWAAPGFNRLKLLYFGELPGGLCIAWFGLIITVLGLLVSLGIIASTTCCCCTAHHAYLKGTGGMEPNEINLWTEQLLMELSEHDFDTQKMERTITLKLETAEDEPCDACDGAKQVKKMSCCCKSECKRCFGEGVPCLKITLISRNSFILLNVGPFILDLFTDLLSVRNYLMAGELTFAFVTLSLWLFTTGAEMRNLLKLPRTIRDCCTSGVQTQAYVDLRRKEVENEAICSLMLMVFSLPWSVTTQFSFFSQMASMALSLKGVTDYMIDRGFESLDRSFETLSSSCEPSDDEDLGHETQSSSVLLKHNNDLSDE